MVKACNGVAFLVLVQAMFLLMVQPTTTSAQGFNVPPGPSWTDFVPPGQGYFPPPFGPPPNFNCSDVDCGKGKCVSFNNSDHSNNGSSYSYNYSYSYGCTCEEGWNKSADGGGFQYLPCVLPNCHFDSSCPQNFSYSKPKSQFDPSNMNPCDWATCGEGGTCVNTSSYTHRCDCGDGFANLLNMTNLPCYKECKNPGSQCQKLGIRTLRSGDAGSSPSPGNGNKGTTAVPGELLVLFMLIASFVVG